ncbi:MAG: alkaline phosphatase [Rhodospirillales bacterium]|jgi:alkaline phosphatase|nr:alkaline phosphatase [Rhodospirillales bacterium]
MNHRSRLLLAAILASGTLLGASALEASPAKNVILMVSDGASWGTWDMTSFYEYGAKGMQPYDSFPVKLGMTTYPLNFSTTPTNDPTPQISYDPAKAWDKTPTGDANLFAGYAFIKQNYTDSAAAGTALAAGIKTYNNAINYDNFGNPVPFITQHAKDMGKATGAISSVPFSHATPAAFGAQNASRNNYHAIAAQMINDGTLDVIMGGGNPLYDSNGLPRATPNYQWLSPTDWAALNDGTAGMTLIQTKADFEALANGTLTPTGRVMGLPQVFDTLQANRTEAVQGADPANPSGVAFNANVPTLETMTKGALNVLGNNPNGLFLMVEGGAVDWMAHANNTGRIIEEQMDFNKSVTAVVQWVESVSNWDDTLVLVLTDHGNGMPMGPDSDTIAFEGIENNGAGQLPGVRWHYGTHTNENTLMFAKGAGAEELLTMIVGVDPGLVDVLAFNDGRYIDNTMIFDAMKMSMGVAAQPVPVPAAALLFLSGLGLPAVALIRRHRQAA